MLSMLYLLSSEEYGEKISSLIFFQLPHEPIEIENVFLSLRILNTDMILEGR